MRPSAPTQAKADLDPLLTSSGVVTDVVQYGRTATVFSQGERCTGVMYLRRGRVILTVRSDAGREGVVARVGPGQFFGEGCLAGRSTRTATATTTAASSVRVIATATMRHLLQREPRVADHFIAHMLARNIRIEQDLLGHVFSLDSTERRLARTLLRLGHYGMARTRGRRVPKITHERLARLVGTTRARVDTLMNRFQRLGFITQDQDTHVHPTLAKIVLDD
jgi:CRP/FNR family transcriptional regulator, cyclic AMP receptor protein